jgi:protein TonB
MFLEIESGCLPARPLRRRLLPVFLAASVALHAAVAVVVVPPPALDYQPAQVRVLEVVLVQSEPPRPLSVEPEQAPLPAQAKRAPERELARAAAVMEPRRRTDAVQPVLALPEPSVAGEPVVAVPRAAEKRSAADARTEVASVAPTLPGFSAAYLRNPAPRYPLVARRAGDQGTVTLRVLVTRNGLPARVDVENSSGSPPLDAAALEAVRAWRFVPARQGPDAIESWVLVPIVFRLEGPS